MKSHRCSLAAAAIAILATAHFEPAHAGAISPDSISPETRFAPHRAIYELSIDTSSAGSSIAGVNGRIVYELTGSTCEGFTQNMRFVTVTSGSEGTNQTSDLRTSSWEQVPANKLRFSSSTYQNDDLAEQARGTAVRPNPQDAPTIDLLKPEKKSFNVGSPVFFPMQHSAALIKSARAGKTRFAADLFDGSENGTKIYTTSALIGQRVAPGAQSIKALAGQKGGSALDSVPSWPVSISYFAQIKDGPVKHKDEVPLYEMSYRFHENGVTSNLRLDYGEYALKGELKELVMLESSTCAADKP